MEIYLARLLWLEKANLTLCEVENLICVLMLGQS
jgi:hypothetical protein